MFIELLKLNTADIQKCERELNEVKNKINLLADKLLSGILTNDLFKKKLHELECKREEIEDILEKQE